MYCMKCNNHLATCVCPDLDERLAAFDRPGSHVLIQKCLKCGKPKVRCACAYERVTTKQ